MLKVFRLLVLCLSFFHITTASEYLKSEECEPGDPLLLTPLIRCEKIAIAREAAQIRNWTGRLDAYSGFLTVNEAFNTNLFFWFFPAQRDPDNAPVILWLQGGPGNSGSFGLLVEHGPIELELDKPKIINYRKYPWTYSHSIIYIDSPAGTGFSYTGNEAGYANNMDDVSRDLYEALIQFFTIFPEFRHQNFFIGGQSYAGKYVPALAYHIHRKQERNLHWDTGASINLKGIFLGSPLIDPRTQLKYADFLYNTGLVDEHQREVVKRHDEELAKLIDEENWMDAYNKFYDTILGGVDSYVYAVSGFNYKYNLLDQPDPLYPIGNELFAEDWFRKSIHVGNLTYGEENDAVARHLQQDMTKSTKFVLETLLTENYKVLLYASQLDIVIPSVSIEALIGNLTWTGRKKYLDFDRRIWKVENEIAGFVKEVDNLLHILIRHAGHHAPYDQPIWCYDMIYRFTRGKPFYKNEF